VHVRGIAEKKTAPAAKLLCGPMIDAIGRKPAARLELELARDLAPYLGRDFVEGDVIPARMCSGKIPITRQRSLPRIGKKRWNASARRYTLSSPCFIAPVASVSATKNVCS
jgi:hypothetical protein